MDRLEIGVADVALSGRPFSAGALLIGGTLGDAASRAWRCGGSGRSTTGASAGAGHLLAAGCRGSAAAALLLTALAAGTEIGAGGCTAAGSVAAGSTACGSSGAAAALGTIPLVAGAGASTVQASAV